MKFSIRNVESADSYLDNAFRKASQKAKGDKKHKELEKTRYAAEFLIEKLDRVLNDFPSIDSLPEFYLELIKNNLNYAHLKKSLGAIKWAEDIITDFSKKYAHSIKRSPENKSAQLRGEFYGRTSRIMKRIAKEISYLEASRKLLKAFPDIKEGRFTICIAGFPNVGKSTLLNYLTGTKAKTAYYAFTTTKLNVGNYKEGIYDVQVVDTPGALARLEKMNFIERQAFLAMKHCADLIIYVFDLTESYPMEKQLRLYKKIKKLGKPMITYVSKTDIIDKADVEEFGKKHKFVTKEKLKEEIKKRVRAWKEGPYSQL